MSRFILGGEVEDHVRMGSNMDNQAVVVEEQSTVGVNTLDVGEWHLDLEVTANSSAQKEQVVRDDGECSMGVERTHQLGFDQLELFGLGRQTEGMAELFGKRELVVIGRVVGVAGGFVRIGVHLQHR